MTRRTVLPNRRASSTTKIRVGGKRTVYLSTDTGHRELFVRVRGQDCTAEIVGLYDCVARLVSLSLQYGAPLEMVAKMIEGVHDEHGGIVVGHKSIHFCSSLPDAIGQHLLSLSQDHPKE